MKRQIRPFVVQVKQKRGSSTQGRSIWGDLDLSSMAADALKDLPNISSSNHRVVDTGEAVVDPVSSRRVEDVMTDPKQSLPMEPQTMMPPAEASTDADTIVSPKKASLSADDKIKAKRNNRKDNGTKAVALDSSAAAARKVKRIYSRDERQKLLEQIGSSLSHGDSLRSAARQAGISEQTYYNWKSAASVSESKDMGDLSKLEEENMRLKRLLAERLQNENAELRKRLGLS